MTKTNDWLAEVEESLTPSIARGTGAILTKPSQLDILQAMEAIKTVDENKLYHAVAVALGLAFADSLDKHAPRAADYAGLPDLPGMLVDRLKGMKSSDAFNKALVETLLARG